MRLQSNLQDALEFIPQRLSTLWRWPVDEARDTAIYQVSMAARTDIGRVRKRNDDSVFAEAPGSAEAQRYGWLAAVADGVGGRPAGDVASGLAIRTLRQVTYVASAGQPGERLRAAADRANAATFDKARSASEYAGMATTLTAALVFGHRLFVAHVGDSRAYLSRDSRLTRLTRDHTIVEDLLRAGDISSEQARTHKRRNVVTRTLGTDEHVEVDLVEMQVQSGDVLLLCTDGLHGAVDEATIGRELRADPEIAADTLVQLANDRGGRDNVSVVVAKLVATPTREPAHVSRPSPRRRTTFLWVAVLIAATVVWLGQDMLRRGREDRSVPATFISTPASNVELSNPTTTATSVP